MIYRFVISKIKNYIIMSLQKSTIIAELLINNLFLNEDYSLKNIDNHYIISNVERLSDLKRIVETIKQSFKIKIKRFLNDNMLYSLSIEVIE